MFYDKVAKNTRRNLIEFMIETTIGITKNIIIFIG